MSVPYYRELLKFCLRKVKSRADAEDLAQESITRMLAMEQTGQAITNAPALLRQIATRAQIDQVRRAIARPTDELDAMLEIVQPQAPEHLQPERICATSQAVQAYLQVIEALPPKCKEAFSLHVFDGLAHAEIAQQLGVSVSMVKQYIQRGKIACAKRRRLMEEPLRTAQRPPQQ